MPHLNPMILLSLCQYSYFGVGRLIVRLVVEAFGFHGEMDLVLKR